MCATVNMDETFTLYIYVYILKKTAIDRYKKDTNILKKTTNTHGQAPLRFSREAQRSPTRFRFYPLLGYFGRDTYAVLPSGDKTRRDDSLPRADPPIYLFITHLHVNLSLHTKHQHTILISLTKSTNPAILLAKNKEKQQKQPNLQSKVYHHGSA